MEQLEDIRSSMTPHDIILNPYDEYESYFDKRVFFSRVVLINFDDVVYHQPDLVCRQLRIENLKKLPPMIPLKISLPRGSTERNYCQNYAPFIQMWNKRHSEDFCIESESSSFYLPIELEEEQEESEENVDENASVLCEEEEVTPTEEGRDFENASDPREESLIEEEEPPCCENASGLGEEGETSEEEERPCFENASGLGEEGETGPIEEEEEAGPVMKVNSSNIEQRAGDEAAHKENMYDATPVPEINQKRVIKPKHNHVNFVGNRTTRTPGSIFSPSGQKPKPKQCKKKKQEKEEKNGNENDARRKKKTKKISDL